MRTELLVSFLICALLSPPAFSQLVSGQERNGPPIEAIEACENLTEGESCSFSNRKGKNITGTCTIKEEILVCYPEKKSREGRGRRGKS